MTVIDVIRWKYPEIQRVSYWNTQDDGTPWANELDGLVWENEEYPKPVQAEFDQWRVEYAVWAEAQQAKQLVSDANNEIIKQLDEIDFKSIRALRTNDTKRLADLETQAILLRKQIINAN